jgi:hypothetical protein
MKRILWPFRPFVPQRALYINQSRISPLMANCPRQMQQSLSSSQILPFPHNFGFFSPPYKNPAYASLIPHAFRLQPYTRRRSKLALSVEESIFMYAPRPIIPMVPQVDETRCLESSLGVFDPFTTGRFWGYRAFTQLLPELDRPQPYGVWFVPLLFAPRP